MAYIDYPVQVSTDLIVQSTLDQLRLATGAALNEGHPLVAAVETLAYRHAETRIIMADIGRAVFRDFGLKVYGVAIKQATRATVLSTWTAKDTAGYTIAAGSRVVYVVTGTQRVGFRTVGPATIPVGATSVTGVELEAVVTGEDANGLPPKTVTSVEQYAWLASVQSTSTSGGGQSDEPIGEYVDRLVTEIRSLSTGGLVLPEDFETAARRVPGVHRALAIDGYDPTVPSSGNEKMVTVALADSDGDPVGATGQTAVETELEARREINFVVHTIDPTYTVITVDFAAVATVDADSVDVDAAVTAQLESFLNKATWGGGGESPPQWRNETVRRNDLIAIVETTPGVDYLTTLTVNGGTADVVLTGVAPLPNATVTGTVT